MDKKAAIITGASGGIGREVAKRPVKDGFSVAVRYAGNRAKAEDAVEEIKTAGGNAIALTADITMADEVSQLFKDSVANFGQIEVVVHCAGIMTLSPIIDNDVKQFDSVITANLHGAFLVLAQTAKHVPDGGRIIAFSSSVIDKSFPAYGAYVASKLGVEGLVRVLANELRGRNISVHAVAPSPVATELFLEGKTHEQIEQLRKIAPMERLGEPIDIAKVVSFLAGPEGGRVNAQVIRANGGYA
jgi:3-oxoacyl-[acyl-carrier protein] reductase